MGIIKPFTVGPQGELTTCAPDDVIAANTFAFERQIPENPHLDGGFTARVGLFRSPPAHSGTCTQVWDCPFPELDREPSFEQLPSLKLGGDELICAFRMCCPGVTQQHLDDAYGSIKRLQPEGKQDIWHRDTRSDDYVAEHLSDPDGFVTALIDLLADALPVSQLALCER